MKLLRLTTDRNDGTFDARFNEDIIIPENSSLALQSCALNVDLSELGIDANNNDITITINGNATIIQLKQNTYDHTNFHKLLNDLTTKFNYVLSTSRRREIASEWLVSHASSGNITLEYRNTSYTLGNAIAIGEQFDEETAGSMNITNSNNGNISPGGVAVADDSVRLNSIHKLTNGCGAFYAKMKGVNNVNGNDFFLALTTENPATLGNTIDPAKIISAVGVKCDGTGAITTQRYFTIKRGVETLSGNTIGDAGAGNTGDIFGIEVQGGGTEGGRIRTVLYRDGVAEQELNLDDILVDATTLAKETFYGVIVMRGATGDIKLSQLKFSSTPYEPQDIALKISDHDSYSEMGVGAPQRPSTAIIDVSVVFEDRTVSEYLGFQNLRLDLFARNDFNFRADALFRPNIENDCFIVVLETMRLESFDGHIQGRKSILCSIPNDDHNATVIYEPNTIIPIKLSNPNEISIRNMRLRVFYQDYTPVLFNGLSVLSLLIM